jgi:hypothetical protein
MDQNRTCSKTFHDDSLWPTRSHLNVTFSGEVSNTLAIILFLWCTILYKVDICSWTVYLPSHLSSENLIFESSLIKNGAYGKNNFFVSLRPIQKCDSPGFQKTKDNVREPMYFLFIGVYLIPSSVRSLKSHLPRSAVFLISRSWIPSPPWSLGWQATLNLAGRYLFFSLSRCQRNLDRK